MTDYSPTTELLQVQILVDNFVVLVGCITSESIDQKASGKPTAQKMGMATSKCKANDKDNKGLAIWVPQPLLEDVLSPDEINSLRPAAERKSWPG
jgi:hypothetical protein